MSSPSPEPQKAAVATEHAYQSSESSEHGLLHHVCPCMDHNHVNQGHPIPATRHLITSHVHPPPKSCACHGFLVEDAGGGDSSPVITVDEIGLGSMHRLQGRKLDADDRIEVSNLPPALPPRPPPRPRADGTLNSRYRMRSASPSSGGIRKYVFWCCICGGLATILGTLFLAVYFLLRSYTSTMGYFETIPTFVPAAMLILTGLCVMSLARRKNRYSYLIKVCGLCCLVCALTCVLVTITTTVIHMNRLQTLRECVYTQKTRTCTCYSVLLESHTSADDGMRFIFDSTPDCEVIHGALYSCLRAMFGLSVSGILVCIFSCMLVYQLLTHEKKKMYWEQLELRCRSFYQQQQAPPTTAPPPSTHSSLRGIPHPPPPSSTYCSCCDECRYPPLPPQVYPWNRPFWPPPPPTPHHGNFYSPNPMISDTQSSSAERSGGWSWRRLPWGRSSARGGGGGGGAPSSADSQYGFGGGRADAASSGGSYSVLDARPPPPAPLGGVYVWGPPPPYSNPNSPARRFHHLHHHAHECRPPDNYENAPPPAPEAAAEPESSTDSGSGQAPAPRKPKKKEADKEEACARFLPRLQGVENAAFQQQEGAKPEASESEVYFADVSSCCTVRNDSGLYDEADARLASLQKPASLPLAAALPTDASSSSLATSGPATPLTDSTDDALTPVAGYFEEIEEEAEEEEAGVGDFLAPDAQYEREGRSNLASTISTGFYYAGGARRGLGSNISALIQNLGGSAALLYGEANDGEGMMREGHSDGGMDSGWQSGSEKIGEGRGKGGEGGDSVNV